MKKDFNDFEFLNDCLTVKGQAYIDDRLSFGKEESDAGQTQRAFGVKWEALKDESENDQETWKIFQKDWYLKLYGFETEDSLKDFLKGRSQKRFP